MIELKIKAVSPLMGEKFPLPAYATAGAAAMDLCACMEEPVTLAPGGGRVSPQVSPSPCRGRSMWRWCAAAAAWAPATASPSPTA